MPAPLGLEDPKNLALWEPWVRAQLVDFDLMSPLHFSQASSVPTLWHLDMQPVDPPTMASCQPIVRMTRPPDPASSGGTLFWQQQLDLVFNWADLRADRAEEIVAQMTPPIAFWATILNLHPERRRWTAELLGAALRLANHVEMRFKHALACRRPVEMSPQIQPMIPTPGHGSLPSGHATEAFIVARVLWELVKPPTEPTKTTTWLEQLMRQAARVAINRTIAGVHFPVDSAAGQMLGLTLGSYFVERATGASQHQAWKFDGSAFSGTSDFDWRLHFDVATETQVAVGSSVVADGAAFAVQPGKLLGELWGRAQGEWP